MPALPMFQGQSEARISSKSTSSVQEDDDDDSSSKTTFENSDECAKEVCQITQSKPLSHMDSSSRRSAEVESRYSGNRRPPELEDVVPQARSQSLLVEVHQKSRLKQLLSPLPILPRLLGGSGMPKSKAHPGPTPSPSSSPVTSDHSFSFRPGVQAVMRARTCDLEGLRSPELDRDPSEAWSMVPNASMPHPGRTADCPTCYRNSHMSCATDKSDRGTLQSLRRRLLELFEEPFGSCSAWVLSVFLILNNSTSLFLLCMEGPVTESSSGRRELSDSLHGQVQLAVNLICSIEALLRFWCSPRRRRSLGHVPNTIDALCVLPFWLIKVAQLDTQVEWPALYLACRLEFGLRLLKLCRYFDGWQLLFLALSDALPALMLPLVALGYIVGLGACMILITEEANMLAGGEPTTLSGFPHALMFCWLCIVAIDEGPFWELEIQSKGGRLIVGVLMMCGLVVFAMPISIVGTCFCRVWFQRHRLLFLEALRRRVEREVMTDTTTTLKELFDTFDEGHTGELGLHEFKWFTRSVFPWLSAATVLTIFSSFDQDQDGAVSFQEVQAAVFPEEADLEFLINGAEEKDPQSPGQQDFSLFPDESIGVATYQSDQGEVLYESSATNGSGSKENGDQKEPPFQSSRSEDGSLRPPGLELPRNSHTSSHSAAAQAQAAATAQTVRLLGVLDTRLRSLEKRQNEIPITPWYALAPPSPAKSLLSTRRSSLKSQPAHSSPRQSEARHTSMSNASHRGRWSSQNSVRSSKISNISTAYAHDVPRKEARRSDDATSVNGMLLGTSQLPSACSSRCPSVMSPGEAGTSRRVSHAMLPQIPDTMTDSQSRSSGESGSAAQQENYWASSRRNTIAGVVGRSSTSSEREALAVQDEHEDEQSPKGEAWNLSRSDIPIMQVTRTGTQSLEIIEDGPGPSTNAAAALAPPKLKSKRNMSRSPSRRVSTSGTGSSNAMAIVRSRRQSTEPNPMASLVRRVSQQEAESGDELAFATGSEMSWNIPSRRNDRRASSARPAVREMPFQQAGSGPASNSNSPSTRLAASAAFDNSHLR